MKKNYLSVLLIIVILGLGGYLFYDKVIVKEEKCKEDNSQTIENKEELSNTNLQKAELVVYDSKSYETSKRLDLEIVNGKLQANLNFEKVDIKGLEGNIKSFLFMTAGCDIAAEINVVAINDKNELFVADVNHYDQTDYLTFKKQSLSKKITDIKTLDFGYLFSTCGQNNLAVVTKDKKIYPYRYDYQNKKFSIFDLDVTNFKKSVDGFIIYTDNTIGLFDTTGEYGDKFNERVKYNNKELKASKIYQVLGNENVQTYVVSDNKLYKIDAEYDGPQITKILNVSLVSEKRVLFESFYGGESDNYIDLNNSSAEIVFEDYSTYKLGSKLYKYNID